jgi:hypothetical protein
MAPLDAVVREDSYGLSVPYVLYALAKQNKRMRTRQRNRARNSRNRPDPSMGPINNIVRYAPSNVFGFPDKLICKLRYHEGQSIVSTTGGLNVYKFRLNSLFDPNYTGTGHQPMYRDTYAGVYNHYSVISTVAKVRFVNNSAAPFWVGAVIEDDSATQAGVDPIIEQNHSKSHLVTSVSGSNSASMVTINWDCKQILGINPYTTESYKTPQGENPGEESFLIVYAATADATTNTILFDVTLDYTVLFSELMTPTAS